MNIPRQFEMTGSLAELANLAIDAFKPNNFLARKSEPGSLPAWSMGSREAQCGEEAGGEVVSDILGLPGEVCKVSTLQKIWGSFYEKLLSKVQRTPPTLHPPFLLERLFALLVIEVQGCLCSFAVELWA